MLVLKRKEGQSLIIGDKIIVKVIEIEGRSVKIGIEAPKDISIVREELLEKIKQKVAESRLDESMVSQLKNQPGQKKDEGS
ncbi:Carbon storage regulator [bacterium HR19]|nr:Carbon storage regulator [bacterium HR19]